MFNNTYEGKRVLITGNTGFKGSWLTIWLQMLGAEVYGYSIDIPTNPALHNEDTLPKDRMLFGDINDRDNLQNYMAAIQPDFVFHLAAQAIVSTSKKFPVETFLTNALGTVNVLQAVLESGIQTNIILITSDKCYENVNTFYGYRENDNLGGEDPYSASKACAEIAASSFFRTYIAGVKHLKMATARAGNVIGGGDWAKDRIVVDCFKNWTVKKPVELRRPNATRPWQHVLEPLSGYLLLGMHLDEGQNLASKNGHSFNFGPNGTQDKSVLELIAGIKRHTTLAQCDVIVGTDNGLSEANLLKLNCDKAHSILGWYPTLDFEKCCELVSIWYSKYVDRQNFDKAAECRLQIKEYMEIAHKNGAIWTK